MRDDDRMNARSDRERRERMSNVVIKRHRDPERETNGAESRKIGQEEESE